MGLDMYIYKATKPTLKAGIYRKDDEIFQQLTCLTKEDLSKNMYKQLKPFCEKVSIVEKVYNKDRLAKDYNLDASKTIYIDRYIGSGIIFTDGTSKTDIITNDEIEYCYMDEQVKTQYVLKFEQEYYWRKAYDVQNLIYSIIKKTTDTDVENCGFYHLTDDIIKKIKEIDSDVIVDNSMKNLFYHEWY